MERFTDICTQVENDLALFVGGELDAATQASSARHLESCAACGAKARAAREAHTALREGLCAANTSAGGPDLWPALRAQLAREGRFSGEPFVAETSHSNAHFESIASARARRRSELRSNWRYAAAAAVLVAALGWWRFSIDDDDAVQPIAQGPRIESPVLSGPRAHAGEPIQTLPVSDSLAQGLRPVPVDEHALLDHAVPVDPEYELRSPIFNVRDPRNGSPAGMRLVVPKR